MKRYIKLTNTRLKHIHKMQGNHCPQNRSQNSRLDQEFSETKCLATNKWWRHPPDLSHKIGPSSTVECICGKISNSPISDWLAKKWAALFCTIWSFQVISKGNTHRASVRLDQMSPGRKIIYVQDGYWRSALSNSANLHSQKPHWVWWTPPKCLQTFVSMILIR